MHGKWWVAAVLVLIVGSASWAGDFSGYRLCVVKEGGGPACVLEDVTLNVTEVPAEGEDWTSETYFWFETDPESMPCLAGENPGIVVLSSSLEPVFSTSLAEENRYCREMYFNPGGSRVVLETGVGEVATFGLYDMNGTRLFEADGVGQCIWIDPYRFLFTRFENQGRGAPLEIDGRTSVAIYDPSGPDAFPVKEATDVSNYMLLAVEEDVIVIEESYVDAPEDWTEIEKRRTREIRVPVPAAG